jgi:hypothetical protein
MNFQELLEKAYELIDEAYNETDYNTKECDNLMEVKRLLEQIIK